MFVNSNVILLKREAETIMNLILNMKSLVFQNYFSFEIMTCVQEYSNWYMYIKLVLNKNQYSTNTNNIGTIKGDTDINI